jgi:2',3'-cyclic-nucleotide 2'-phosphodiesterase (5'-nucleotidase family)
MRKVQAVIFTVVLLLALSITTTVFASTEITIFHTNDMHGRFEPAGNVIGIDTIAAILEDTENAFLVDAGDTFHGMPFVNLNQGQNGVELMNLAGYGLFTPGNHDFNYGVDRLAELSAQAEFAFISANIYRNGQLLFEPVYIANIGGVRVGFFGLSHPDTAILTHPNNVMGVTFGEPIAAGRSAVAYLQNAGVDVIIGLVHLGSDTHAERRGDDLAVQLANAIPEIDVIIDGHSHTLHGNGLDVNGVVIVQAGQHGQNVGRVDIVVGDGVESITASAISVEYARENFTPVAEVTAAIERKQGVLDELLDIVVGYNPVILYGDTTDRNSLRSMEVPIGNLVADAVRHVTNADIALHNSGGIRADLPAGSLTKRDIVSILPFNNYVVVMELTAAQLLEVLEHSVSAVPGNGRFMQVSGVSFSFDPEQPEGYRVFDVSVGGRAINTVSTMTVATNNFVASGGDGFTTFADLEALSEAANLDEVLIAYMAVANMDNRIVEGRIVIADFPVDVPTNYLPQWHLPVDGMVDGSDILATLPTRELNGVTYVAFRDFAIATDLTGRFEWNNYYQAITILFRDGYSSLTFAVADINGFNDNGRVYIPLNFAEMLYELDN